MDFKNFQDKPFVKEKTDVTSSELNRTVRLLRSHAKNKYIVIATLGPKGTSSDLCCRYFGKSILNTNVKCKLFSSYEEAALSVDSGESDLLLVANAYHKINEFYISYSLELSTFFVFDTADYGIATKSPDIFSLQASVKSKQYILATHPAPAHLIPRLMADFECEYTVEYVLSTSQAAKLVASGDSDLCLTNTIAAENEGLQMCTDTYRIRMLWSIFKSRCKNDIPTFNTPRILTHYLRPQT